MEANWSDLFLSAFKTVWMILKVSTSLQTVNFGQWWQHLTWYSCKIMFLRRPEWKDMNKNVFSHQAMEYLSHGQVKCQFDGALAFTSTRRKRNMFPLLLLTVVTIQKLKTIQTFRTGSGLSGHPFCVWLAPRNFWHCSWIRNVRWCPQWEQGLIIRAYLKSWNLRGEQLASLRF